MNDQTKLGRKSGKSGSLFERADAVFGLEGLGTSSVPKNLPESRKPKAYPKPEPEVVPRAHPATTGLQNRDGAPVTATSAPAQKVVQAVKLSGPQVTIDRESLFDAGLIDPEMGVTGLLEEFRIVKRELLADARASDEDACRRVLVSSPHPGEGKTYCATNLAIALAAETDIEVVLVDADMIKPSIAKRLGLAEQKGLMDALANKQIKPEELVCRTNIEGLFVMQAGTSTSRDAELLASERTGEVLDRLTAGAPNRFIIFDTPPALAASPAAELAAHVGQTLLVVRADQTGRASLEDARQLLSACPDIKLLLNAAQFSPSGRRFGDYGEKEE